MIRNRFSPSPSKPKQESPPGGAGLKRAISLPTHPPSNPRQRPEVKPARPPITRPTPDANPPEDYSSPPIKPRKICGIPAPFQKAELKKKNEQRILEGSERKTQALDGITDATGFRPEILGDSEYMDVIKAYHPKFDNYSRDEKLQAINILKNHPRFLAGIARTRNEVSGIPNGPTATRKMKPDEQAFLTNAFRRLDGEFKKKPFHIHGETAAIGDRQGKIVRTDYSPEASVESKILAGEKYHLHTHPPYGKPFDSSASAQDHKIAAHLYRLHDNKMGAYVTNGKDVLHIQPDSLELVKLIPDPKVEKKLGKFPEAFKLPNPQEPPYPFPNHEAPAAYKPWAPES